MELLELTRELLAIPSHEDEGAVGSRIEAWLRAHTPAEIQRDDAGNVIARRGSNSGQSLALVGHHDVVPPADEQVDAAGEYRVTTRDGRLYGRGAADMKGAVAAAMLAFRDASIESGSLIFASFVGEERGGLGAQAAVDKGFTPDRAIVGEGSTGYSAAGVTDVAIAHKGRRGSTLEARGRAAHASEPESGENAIYRASDAIQAVRDLEHPSGHVLNQSIQGSVTITEVEGGTAWNVIPDHCSITVDERTVPNDRAALSTVEDLPGIAWTIDQDLPPMACEDEEFAATILDVARENQPGQPDHVVKPHATDAGWLAKAGTDCVVCGPAEQGEAHTADESASIEVLQRCCTIYRVAAERVCS